MQKNPRLSAILEKLSRIPPLTATVNLVVGELIPIRDDEIRAHWHDSPLAKIELIIRRISAELQCMVCFRKYRPVKNEVACPYCGGVGAKIISGEEFYFE